MGTGKTLILIDSLINFFLGIVLLAYSNPVVDLFGLPFSENRFYPNILGAVLFGIGIALIIEYRRTGEYGGLGLGGAISINISGGLVLFYWLLTQNLSVPLRGKIILWVLDIVLLGISSLELIAGLNTKKQSLK